MNKKICPICQKEIEGMSDSQSEYLLKIHIISKHPGRFNFEITEVKKGDSYSI
ncbi:MAG TPA: hypothetical protein VGB37_15165 [Candidatus Lokiarchaeia archaeon]